MGGTTTVPESKTTNSFGQTSGSSTASGSSQQTGQTTTGEQTATTGRTQQVLSPEQQRLLGLAMPNL